MWSYTSHQPKQTNTTEQNVNISILCTSAKTEEEVLNDKICPNFHQSKSPTYEVTVVVDKLVGDILEPFDAIHGGLIVDSRRLLMRTRLGKMTEMP